MYSRSGFLTLLEVIPLNTFGADVFEVGPSKAGAIAALRCCQRAVPLDWKVLGRKRQIQRIVPVNSGEAEEQSDTANKPVEESVS